MRILLMILAPLILLSGCLSTEKAKKFLRSHAQEEADMCAVDFPVKVDSTVIVKIDTVREQLTEQALSDYADSIIRANVPVDNHAQFYDEIARLEHENAFNKATADALRAQLRGSPVIDTVALKKSIEAKIKATVTPCADSLIKLTKENTANLSSLQFQNLELKGQLESQSHASDKWKKWFFIAGGIALFFIILTIIKFIK